MFSVHSVPNWLERLLVVSMVPGLVGAASRQRGLFPLPPLDEKFNASASDVRGMAQRHLHTSRSLAWANEGISALNSMAGYGSFDSSKKTGMAVDLALGSFASAYIGMGKPPADVASDEEAFSSLLGSSSYSGERTDLVDYSRDLISWPALRSEPVSLLSVLPGHDRVLLESWQQSLLRDPTSAAQPQEESGIRRPYSDPSLFTNLHTYAEFLRGLQSRGMVRFIKRTVSNKTRLWVF